METRDGALVVHIRHDDRPLTICTGEPYSPAFDLPPGTKVTLCEACRLAVNRG